MKQFFLRGIIISVFVCVGFTRIAIAAAPSLPHQDNNQPQEALQLAEHLENISLCVEEKGSIVWYDVCVAQTAKSQQTRRQSATVSMDDQGKVTIQPTVAKSVPQRHYVETRQGAVSDDNDSPYGLLADPDAHKPTSQPDFIRDFISRENPLNNFEFGWETSYFSFEVPSDYKEKGVLNGIFGTYTYRFKTPHDFFEYNKTAKLIQPLNMIKLDARYSWADLEFKNEGNIDDPNHNNIDDAFFAPPFTTSIAPLGFDDNDIENQIFEARVIAGYDIPTDRSSWVTPYLGLGYRMMFDDTKKAFGYERRFRYAYIPIGLEGLRQWTSGWELTFNLEYDYLASGEQKDLLNESGLILVSSGKTFSVDPVEYDLDKGFGARGSFKLVRKRKDFDLFFEPFVRYWEVEQTEREQLTSEGGKIAWLYSATNEEVAIFAPENKTIETGMRIGLAY
jgi:hypothetical protein